MDENINDLMAEILGWKKGTVHIFNTGEDVDAWKDGIGFVFCSEWKPTERIEQAWRAVKQIQQQPGYVGFRISHNIYYGTYISSFNLVSHEQSESEAMAICLAALKWVSRQELLKEGEQ